MIYKKISQLLKQNKIIKCSSCGVKYRIPVKSGKVLLVTCPSCKCQVKVSFINPVMAIIQGRVSWKNLNQNEKRKMIMLLVASLIAVGVIISYVI